MKNEEKYKTIAERKDAFNAFCDQYCTCKDCPISACGKIIAGRDGCVLYWLDIEAEDEKLLACPFCGSTDIKVIQATVSGYVATCNDCWAASRAEITKDDAIAAWNRRVK